MDAALSLIFPVASAPAAEAPRDLAGQNKISIFAQRVFAELSLSIALNCAVMLFTATPISIPALTLIAITALIGVGVRMIFEAQFDDNNDDFDACMPPIGEVVGRLTIVNTLGMSSLNILIHEAGHALSAWMCFIKPNIKIHLDYFVHGDTSFTVSNGLTRFGNYLGKHNAITLFRGAGLICSTVFAMTEIAAAFFVKDSCPQASLTLNCHAFSQIANDVLYGLAALTSNGFNVRNDYLALWKIGGIHPLIPMTLMIALPVIQYCALKYVASQ